MDRIEKLELVAKAKFIGLLPDYHRRMGEAIIHALVNWIPEEHIDDVLSDIQYHSDKVIGELNDDIRRHRV